MYHRSALLVLHYKPINPLDTCIDGGDHLHVLSLECVFVLQSCQETNVFQAGSITCLRVIHGALLSSLVSLAFTCMYMYLSNSSLFWYLLLLSWFSGIKSCHVTRYWTTNNCLNVVMRWRLALAIIPDKPYKKSGFIISICMHATADLWHPYWMWLLQHSQASLVYRSFCIMLITGVWWFNGGHLQHVVKKKAWWMIYYRSCYKNND